MQPYFFPYIGYFQLIAAVDLFIVYDNIKYTKKGWINRNRYLLNGNQAVFTVPLKSDSDFLHVRDRLVAEEFDRGKLLAKLEQAYRRAPFFTPAFAVFEGAVSNTQLNLFDFLNHSIAQVCAYLRIKTQILPASHISIDHGLKSQEKVLALCEQAGASVYINSIGGQELYTCEEFAARGLDLKFLRPTTVQYEQFGDAFVPWLSILDVMMFNSRERIREFLARGYELVDGLQ